MSDDDLNEALHKEGYILDAESTEEMARLLKQDRLVTKIMGGLLAEWSDQQLLSVEHILDIGSGPGGWVLGVAHGYPKIEVVGIDISETMVAYASAQARVQGLDNARFQIMDATQPLDFPDNAFDIVNARTISGFMRKDSWPQLMQECLRITRPGGTIRLTDGDWGLTNSSSAELLIGLCNRAWLLKGRSGSPDGRYLGFSPMLSSFLLDAGYVNVQRKLYPVDSSADTEGHYGFYQDFVIVFQLVKPLVTALQLISEDEYDRLYRLALAEIMQDNFCAIGCLVTAWGQKPQE